MGLLSDLANKAKAILGRAPEVPEPIETQALPTTQFDRNDWAGLRDSPAMARLASGLHEHTGYVSELMQDYFSTFMRFDPQVRPVGEMATTHVANRTVIEKFLQTPEVRELREKTCGDKYGTAMAMLATQDVIFKTADTVHEATQEAEQREQEAEQRRQDALDALQQALDGMPEPGDGDADGDGEPSDQESDAAAAMQAAMDQFNQATQDAQDARADAEQAADQAYRGQAKTVRAAAEDVVDKLNTEAALMSAYGVEPGTLERMSVEERIALGEHLRSSRLAKAVDLLGAWKRVQGGESRKRVVNAGGEIFGYRRSNDVIRMAPSELVNFADEDLEDAMWARAAEHQLLTYATRGKERLGQGPIIFVGDESTSMTTEDVAGCSREAWAKGLALAMLAQAKQRKRDFWYIGFSSEGRERTLHFPNGESDLPKVLDMTETFLAGGTHWEGPLLSALQIIEEHYDRTGNGRPDIVFATDDEYSKSGIDTGFMAEWNRVRAKTSIKCYGIALGCKVSGALEAVADNVRPITELASDPRESGDLFRTI